MVYGAGENFKIMADIETAYDFRLRIPKQFVTAIADDEVTWIRKDYRGVSQNLIFRKVPYREKEQLSEPGLLSLRDSTTRKYITSTEAGSFMKVNNVDLPVISQNYMLGEHYVMESRGIWDMEGAFMGGAFISYLVHPKDGSELIFIDAFVHAPGKQKRDYILQLDHIFRTLEVRSG